MEAVAAVPEENFAPHTVTEEPVIEQVEERDEPGEQNQQIQGRDAEQGVGAAGGEKRWPGWPGDSVFRLLVPSQKVGGIIGRKGECIKKMCEESKARIKVLDGTSGAPEKIVIISAKEEQDLPISPAMDGLLRVHRHSIDGFEEELPNAATNAGNVIRTRLLVAASQAGSLIGKQGATIKSIQEASGCGVRIVEELPVVALHDDRVVEIQGEPTGVHKAVELIAGQLRKFLVDRSVLPLFETSMSMRNAHIEHNIPPPQSWGHPQGLPPHSGGVGFGSHAQFMPARPPPDNYYPTQELPPIEKQPHHGVSAYGREPPHVGGPATTNQSQAVISQVTQHMQIPLSYADAVIGTAGASISYIRRASGATITIQESRSVPGEMTVEVNGSATQVQTAQQLIQNFMAEATAAPQNTAPPADQGYGSYQSQGSNMYTSTPGNAGPTGHSSGGYGYGSGYGTNYGY